eukprot:34513_1
MAKRASIINHITTKGIIFSCIFMLIHVIVVYCDQYINLLPTTDKHGCTSYICGFDVLFLCIQTPLPMFICYFTQKQSISKDLCTKHLLLIILTQIITLVQTNLHFVSLWSLGIVAKSIMNALSIVFICLGETLVFRKKLFKADYVGIVLLLMSIGSLFILKILNSKQHTQSTLFGIAVEFANCLCSTFTCLIAEYVCKIDYVAAMNKQFGLEWNSDRSKTTMSTQFWLGVNGLVALPLFVFLVLVLSIPQEGSYIAIDLSNFMVKLLANRLLAIVFMVGVLMLFLKSYFATKVSVHVSSMAKKLLKTSCMIPVWLINIFIATNPKKGGKYLDSFDPYVWSEWFLILSFFFSVAGVMVYYEIGVPDSYRRRHANATKTQTLSETTDGSLRVTIV